MATPIAVTISQAVKLSGLSRSALYVALRNRELSARKAGRRTLIGYADLETYLASLPVFQTGE
jgi:excisionase family DNA binding protein